jgi:predicted nucleic acid-binding protein
MYRILLDTNVILDILLQRAPWVATAAVVWQAAIGGRLNACVTASSFTDIFYIARKLVGPPAARAAVRDCLDVLTVLPVERTDLETDHASPLADFEDAVQLACAVRQGMNALVTRDPNGFPNAPLAVWSPADLVAKLTPPAAPTP